MTWLRWDLIGVGLGGLAVAVTLFIYMDGKVSTLRSDINDLKLFIDDAFHEAALDRATAADDLNYRLGFERGQRVRQFMEGSE